jgi:hypothetical protein
MRGHQEHSRERTPEPKCASIRTHNGTKQSEDEPANPEGKQFWPKWIATTRADCRARRCSGHMLAGNGERRTERRLRNHQRCHRGTVRFGESKQTRYRHRSHCSRGGSHGMHRNRPPVSPNSSSLAAGVALCFRARQSPSFPIAVRKVFQAAFL